MKNYFIFTLLVGCALIFACQRPTVSNYERFLNSWIGKSEAQLVTTWGAPIEMQTIAPGRQIFVYIKEKQIDVPGNAPIDAVMGQGSLYNENNDAMGQVYDYYCKTTFTTQDDIIVDYAWAGDGCLMD